MNKTAKKLLALVLLVGVAFGAAPSKTALEGAYEWVKDSTLSASTGYDTIGDGDSVVFLDAFVPDRQGWEYVLTRDAITGTGSDSVSVQIRLDAKDSADALIYSTNIDTMTAAAGEAIVVPFGSQAIGYQYDLKGVAYGDDGGQVIFNRIYMYRRRANQTTKDR